ncbi:LysR family transcriptional regulator [Hansschlegelia sp. KR7-227]|uniref:LysR family transcriptional regulator n=1 Tax=Hansschlegelia sp. KR7-227 TaxID=3400914 RepID=UPI003BFD3055
MKIFVEAARYGSFTMAAEKLGLTQSAISISIKKLEEKHGVVLFDRSGRRLLVTDAGQVLLGEAERILRDVELTIRRVESRRSPQDRYPIVACTPNAYDFWMPGLVARMGGGAEMPQVELLRGGADDVTAWVMRGTADVGVTEIVPSHPQFRHLGVFPDRLILAATPAKARSLPPDLSWDTLQDHGPLLWEQTDLTPIISEALSARRINPARLGHPHLRLTSAAAVLSALEAGRFAGFVSERAARAALSSGALARVGRLEISLRYWMFSLRERDIEAFASLVAKAAHEAAAERAEHSL